MVGGKEWFSHIPFYLQCYFVLPEAIFGRDDYCGGGTVCILMEE